MRCTTSTGQVTPMSDSSSHSIQSNSTCTTLTNNPSNHSAHHYNLEDYAVKNSKFMRVDRDDASFGEDDPDMDLLLGELDEAVTAMNMGNYTHGRDNKRHMFASQKSVTSIIDEARQSKSSPAWFNRSCPNLANNFRFEPTYRTDSLLSQVKELEQEEPIEEFFDEAPCNTFAWHHSQPDLFSPSNVGSSPSECSKPNFLMMNRVMARRAQSVRNLPISSSFDFYETPQQQQKQPATTSPLFNHEHLILSPIGDGSTDGLIEKLQGIVEGSERLTDDIFEPMPF
jgi:hypothetical protein